MSEKKYTLELDRWTINKLATACTCLMVQFLEDDKPESADMWEKIHNEIKRQYQEQNNEQK